MNPHHPGTAAMFFSASDRPFEPLSFGLGLDRGEDVTHHRAGDGNLSQLKGDGTSVAHDPSADLDQLQLQAGQRPVGHRLGQIDAA